MDTLGLNGKHRSWIQDNAKLIFHDLRQTQFVALLYRLEALADLWVLRKRFELFEQAEVLEPILSADTLSDQVGEFRIGLMDESPRGDTFQTMSADPFHGADITYRWSRL